MVASKRWRAGAVDFEKVDDVTYGLSNILENWFFDYSCLEIILNDGSRGS